MGRGILEGVEMTRIEQRQKKLRRIEERASKLQRQMDELRERWEKAKLELEDIGGPKVDYDFGDCLA